MSVGLLGMNAPDVWELWLFTSFAGIAIAAGTLALFAALGSLGQLIAMLLFIYLALASSGGTIPLQALPSPLRFVANFEPLRQVLDGVRSILYFGASGAAGLTRGIVLTAIGLVFWLLVGLAVTTWYDRRGKDRMQPEMLAYVHQSAAAYRARGDWTSRPPPTLRRPARLGPAEELRKRLSPASPTDDLRSPSPWSTGAKGATS